MTAFIDLWFEWVLGTFVLELTRRLLLRIALVCLMALLVSSFAHAGAMFSWCDNIELPTIRVCEDQTGEYLETDATVMIPFKFAGYGEDHSIAHFIAEGSEFKLVTEAWGLNKFLIDSLNTRYELQCGIPQHGLCPRSQANSDGITAASTHLELTCEGLHRSETFEVRRSDKTNKLYFFGKGAAPAEHLEFTLHSDGSIYAGHYIVFKTRDYAFNEWTYERFICYPAKAE